VGKFVLDVPIIQVVPNVPVVQASLGLFQVHSTFKIARRFQQVQTLKTFEPRETSRDGGDACDATDGVVGSSK
jgi:hypothetical protein